MESLLYLKQLLNLVKGELFMSPHPDIEGYNNFYANADLSKYAGEWVVIVGGKVIAHGKSVKQLIEEAKKDFPNAVPFVAKVPLKDVLIW